jgi:hypothetical protein
VCDGFCKRRELNFWVLFQRGTFAFMSDGYLLVRTKLGVRYYYLLDKEIGVCFVGGLGASDDKSEFPCEQREKIEHFDRKRGILKQDQTYLIWHESAEDILELRYRRCREFQPGVQISKFPPL